MEYRSPVMVFFVSLITFGIYGLVWYVKTKNEMNAKGAQIPTAWLIIIPIANIYWLWRYAQGVEFVTSKEMSAATAFILMFLLGIIGMAIVQSKFNSVST